MQHNSTHNLSLLLGFFGKPKNQMRVCVFYVFQYTLIEFSPKNMKYLLELREFQFQMRNSVQLESLHNSVRSRKPHVHVAGRMQHFLGKWKHLIHVPSILNAVIFYSLASQGLFLTQRLQMQSTGF